MHVVSADLLFVFNQTETDTSLRQHLFADVIQLPKRHAGPCRFCDRPVCFQNDLINRPLLLRKMPVYRIGSRDVRTVALVFCAQIHQQQRAVLADIPVGFVVQHCTVCTASGNRRERSSIRTLIHDLIFKIRLCLIFRHARFQMLHHILQCIVSDSDRRFELCDLVCILLHPHLRHIRE